MNNQNLKMILVSDRAWGIGVNGDLLVHIPSDLKYFKKKTIGGLIIMGRKTADSFPDGKPLPDRINVMLSTTEVEREGYLIVKSAEELFKLLETKNFEGKILEFDEDRVYVAGGGKVFAEFLPFVNSILITKMDAEFDADTFFVNLDEDEDFEMTSESENITENGITFRYCEYSRKNI